MRYGASGRYSPGFRAQWARWVAGLAALLSSACAHGEGIAPLMNTPSPELAVVAGDAQTAIVGQDLPVPVSVVLRDVANGGIPMRDQLLLWTVTKGGGRIPFTMTRTDAAGRSTQSWTLGELATSDSLRIAHPDDGGALAASVQVGAVALHDVPVPSGWTYSPATLKLSAAVNVRVVDSITVHAMDRHGNIWSHAGPLTVVGVNFDGNVAPGFATPVCAFTSSTVQCPVSSMPDCVTPSLRWSGVYVISLSLGIADAPILTVKATSF